MVDVQVKKMLPEFTKFVRQQLQRLSQPTGTPYYEQTYPPPYYEHL